ncbi:MAG TPA: class I adenylate-forming enzyme family protein [Stellaceae bacterium]|nr:class I adenylate-forming enzyme family protein [Stellaceae bacterium]
MTLDYIEFHAAERPDAVAFVDNGGAITYRHFGRDVRKMITALQEFGLTRGAWVGVGVGNAHQYLHWVILLALDRLGIATVSLFPKEAPEAYRILDRLSLVISEWEYPGAPIKRHHAITPAWLEKVLALPEIGDDALPVESGDDIVRVLRTTGTTGRPKILLSARRELECAADCWAWKLGLSRHSRYMLTIALEVNTIYGLATAALRAGAMVVFETRIHLAEAFSRHGITDVCLFPIDLKAVLDTLPPGYVKPPNLAITSFGAVLSDDLRTEVSAKLANTLYDDYGAREVGFVSRVASSGGIGVVSPNVQVEVVDDRGVALPFGQVGKLRIRSPMMRTVYLDDPEATSRAFQDDWFISSDLAVLHGPRRLQIMGRSDEALNIGGRKFPPEVIESRVQSAVDARDVGVFSASNPNGIEEIWVAVAHTLVDDKELWERIQPSLSSISLQFVRLHIVRLPAIPRNHGGKIQRNLLKQAVAQAREISNPA